MPTRCQRDLLRTCALTFLPSFLSSFLPLHSPSVYRLPLPPRLCIRRNVRVQIAFARRAAKGGWRRLSRDGLGLGREGGRSHRRPRPHPRGPAPPPHPHTRPLQHTALPRPHRRRPLLLPPQRHRRRPLLPSLSSLSGLSRGVVLVQEKLFRVEGFKPYGGYLTLFQFLFYICMSWAKLRLQHKTATSASLPLPSPSLPPYLHRIPPPSVPGHPGERSRASPSSRWRPRGCPMRVWAS